ncbi:hypothetical protein BX666DRAFT_1924896 [Dichotomocladium elegans]|nr:hypothetical protein BX666DRAFT_1924896 [Dichotomocladium elegans]
MKFTATVAALFAFAASVSAQGISVINPIAGAQWKAGTTQTITWTVTNATSISSIVLRQGDASNLDTVYTITSQQIPATALQYQWAIDATTPPGNDYSVAVNTDLGQQYSPFFAITPADAGSSSAAPSASGSAGPVSSSAGPASASAPVSSAQPSARASSSAKSPSSSTKASASASATPSQEGAATSVKVNLALGVAAAGAVVALF